MLVLVSLLGILFSGSLHAAQKAVVVTDGAMVYRQADFDATVIGYFRAGQKIDISNKKFGQAFYRVRFKQGVLGYLADVDVQLSEPAKPDKSASGPKDEASEKSEKEEKRRPSKPKSLATSTYLGVQGGVAQYAEIIQKAEYRDSLPVYGLKFTSPFGLLEGPFLFDLGIVGSPRPAKFYDQFSTVSPKGYVILGALQILYPLMQFGDRRGLMAIGGGPLLAYSSALIDYQGSRLDASEVRAGAVFSLSFGLDLGGEGGLVLKLEPQYVVEKTNYTVYLAGLQFGL